MIKQVRYIVTACLVLAVVFAGYSLMSILPWQTMITNDNNVAWCGTTDQQIEGKDPEKAGRGKDLFMQKCASCHALRKDLTGPGLGGFESRGPWADRKQLYKWVRNPEGFMKTDAYTKNLRKKFSGLIMPAFSAITDEEIDAIAEFIR